MRRIQVPSLAARPANRRLIPAARIVARRARRLAHDAPIAVLEAEVVERPALARAPILAVGPDVLALLRAVGPVVGGDHLRVRGGVAVADGLCRGVVGLAVGVEAVAVQVAVAGQGGEGLQEEDGGDGGEEMHGGALGWLVWHLAGEQQPETY